MSLSVCILINRWHPKLEATLDAYADCCDEILLGVNGDFNPDAYSFLKKYTRLKFIPLEWKGYGVSRNELAAFAKNDWVLFVDTDEVANKELQHALENFNPISENHIFALKLRFYLGEQGILYGAWRSEKRNFHRLYNRKYTKWDEVPVHEGVIIQADSKISVLPGRINHYTAENYEELIEKNKHYARLSAKKYKAKGKIPFPGRAALSAAFNFVLNYFFRLGFLDGKAGWQVSKAMAYYTYWKYQLLSKEYHQRG